MYGISEKQPILAYKQAEIYFSSRAPAEELQFSCLTERGSLMAEHLNPLDIGSP